MRVAIIQSVLLTFLGGIPVTQCSPQSSPSDISMGFALDLYRVIGESQKDENIVFSPLSVTLALGMVGLGAKETTLHQIRKAIKDNENQEGPEFKILRSISKAMTTTTASEDYSLKLANALYVQEGSMLRDQYLHSSRDYFNATIKMVNFHDRAVTAKRLNSWVENQTNGKIRHLFSSQEFNPHTRMVLVNAIYFKGAWKQKFSPENTLLMDFTKQDGSVTQIPMMHLKLTTNIGYFTNNMTELRVLELLYSGDEASLIVILPAKCNDIEYIEKLITAEQIHTWLSEMTEEEVEINLPRFKIEQKINLKKSLRHLNVTEIFESGSNLSRMSDSMELHISKAAHQAFIEVNEEGSEAAASTGMQAAAIMSLQHHKFVADHPFLFIIKHNTTGSILFMGRVMNPEIMNSNGRDTEAL
ncbi:serpin I2-like [Acipenser ruthenus]|uniref:serpin I2-like n=1 Tax=Acipenser ruthenus TaxID=7906 RepID=UPI002740ABEB|nr:serpin I2-like [Acipenser ruthenus]